MIKKCASKLLYIFCLFVTITATPLLKAQSFTLSNGQVLTYTSTPLLIAGGSGSGANSPFLNSGGMAGTVNLMTSGYNAVQIQGYAGAGNVDNAGVYPMTPAQVAAGTLLATEISGNYTYDYRWLYTGPGSTPTSFVYESPTWVPPIPSEYTDQTAYQIGVTTSTVLTLNANGAHLGTGNFLQGTTNGTFVSWFQPNSGGGTSTPDPSIMFYDVGSSSSTVNDTLIWTNGQLHLTDGTRDVIIAVPSGWNGDVAINLGFKQAPNLVDSWYNYAYYLTATLSTPVPPSGTISVSAPQVQTHGKVNVTWQLN